MKNALKILMSRNYIQNKMIYNSTLNDYEKICSSCGRSSFAVNIVLFAIFFISTGTSGVSVYFNLYIKNILKQQFIKCNSVEHINGKY